MLSRVETHSNPDGDDGGKRDCRKEVGGELVVARCNATEVFQATEGGFDPPALAIALFVISNGALAVDPSRNDGLDPVGLELVAQGIGIVPLVGNQALERPGHSQEIAGGADVADVAGGEPNDGGPAQKIRQNMDFGSLSAARWADGLGLRPPFPPCAERCAFT